MELLKNKISTCVKKGEKIVQITLDDDYNVSDTKLDIDKVIDSSGQIILDDVEVMANKIRVKGELVFCILYHTGFLEKPIDAMEGKLPFEEMIHMDDILPMDQCQIIWEIEDLNVSVMNSRKVSLRALVELKAMVFEQENMDITYDIEEKEGIECLYKEFPISSLIVHKKDGIRLKQEIELASSKPNMCNLVYKNVRLQNFESRLLDGEISIKGDLSFFFIYLGNKEHIPVQYVQQDITFSEKLKEPLCREDMTWEISAKIGNMQADIKNDSDGEERIIFTDVMLDLYIKIYEDTNMRLLWDTYSKEEQIDNVTEEFAFESLIAKNHAKTKISQRVGIKQLKGRVLSVLNMDGNIKIDHIARKEGAIGVEGAVIGRMMCLTEDDKRPIQTEPVIMPFEYDIEVAGIREQQVVNLVPSLEQVSAMMLDGNEAECKAFISFSILAFEPRKARTIVEVKRSPFDMEKRNNMAGMIGYTVKPEDTLWSIAKNYFTTVEKLKELNHLKTDEVSPGEKLLIMK